MVEENHEGLMSLIASAKEPTLPACPRVLVVDDEPQLVEAIRDFIEGNLDCHLTIAASLKEAKKILSTQPVELLVTDVKLPDGDGTDLLPALRKHQPLAEAIVITGAPSVEVTINALRHGAADFLAKPFTAAGLVERVRRALYRQSEAAK